MFIHILICIKACMYICVCISQPFSCLVNPLQKYRYCLKIINVIAGLFFVQYGTFMACFGRTNNIVVSLHWESTSSRLIRSFSLSLYVFFPLKADSTTKTTIFCIHTSYHTYSYTKIHIYDMLNHRNIIELILLILDYELNKMERNMNRFDGY